MDHATPAPLAAGAAPRICRAGPAVVLFIGGAADKRTYCLAGPYRNITFAQLPFERRLQQAGLADACQTHYLGYHEVCDEASVRREIDARVPDRTMPVHLVGHSIGAWSAAHLTQWLGEHGYRVETLVTLDPVGAGLMVRLCSRLRFAVPRPRPRLWINVRATPSRPDASDLVAWLGRKWALGTQPDIDAALDLNHANARALFLTPLPTGHAAADYVLDAILAHARV